MTKLPTSDELNHLSREELLALVLHLVNEVQMLRAEVERLKGPPPTSHNSSQPPSRDWKVNRSQRRAKPQGAKPGHTKLDRPLVTTPDCVVVLKLEMCEHGCRDLHAVAAQRIVRRQLTDLPEIKPVVIETQQYEVACPACHTVQQGALPAELAASRHFGPRLEALVTYLHHKQHISFERLQLMAHDVLGLDLSEGGAVAIIERAGAAA